MRCYNCKVYCLNILYTYCTYLYMHFTQLFNYILNCHVPKSLCYLLITLNCILFFLTWQNHFMNKDTISTSNIGKFEIYRHIRFTLNRKVISENSRTLLSILTNAHIDIRYCNGYFKHRCICLYLYYICVCVYILFF